MKSSLYQRKSCGQLCYTIGLLLIPVFFALAAFAVDTMHMVTAQHELQCAVDAGALAGAIELGQTTVGNAQHAAYVVTEKNSVDSIPVSPTAAKTTVNVTVTPATFSQPGMVTVSATRSVDFIFSRILGQRDQLIDAIAIASGSGRLTQVPGGEVFPLALSLDAVAQSQDSGVQQPALRTLHVGNSFTVYLGPDNEKNGSLTSFQNNSANIAYLRSAIDEALGVTKTASPPVVPPLAVGTLINLNNGESAFQYLLQDSQFAAIMNQPYVLFPLVEGIAPYNQSRPLVGFVALKITHLKREKGVPMITGIIVKPAIRGQTGDVYQGQTSDTLTELSPCVVRLIR
jgi:hypothetical protein